MPVRHLNAATSRVWIVNVACDAARRCDGRIRERPRATARFRGRGLPAVPDQLVVHRRSGGRRSHVDLHGLSCSAQLPRLRARACGAPRDLGGDHAGGPSRDPIGAPPEPRGPVRARSRSRRLTTSRPEARPVHRGDRVNSPPARGELLHTSPLSGRISSTGPGEPSIRSGCIAPPLPGAGRTCGASRGTPFSARSRSSFSE